MGHWIEYILFRFAGIVLRFFPLTTVQRAGAGLGEFVGMRLGYRRAVTMDNLRNAFPDEEEKKLWQITRGAFRSVGTALFEFLSFPRMDPAAIARLIEIENPELVAEAYSRGKGLILLTAHFGNWEVFAQSIPIRTGIPLHVIVKPQANRRIDGTINQWRTMFGNTIVPMDSVRELLKVLHEKKAVGIVADQTAAKESISVPFFGRAVPTFEGPAVFSLKTGAPLLLGFAVRRQNGSYSARFQEVPSGDICEYTRENVAELTRRHVALTESVIRQYPDQWMWMHKRWKHVPSRLSGNKPPVPA